MRFQGDNAILSETNATGTNTSSAITVNDAYGYEAFISATFASISPLAIASTGWDDTTDVITSVAHGLYTGMVVQVTTDGVLPTGIAGTTDYWIIRLTDDTFSVASSLANAEAGTAVNFTAAGSGNHTLTQQTDVATFIIQSSPDNVSWFTHDAMSAVSIVSANQNKHFESAAKYLRLSVSIAKGAATLSGWIQSKG